MEWAKLIEELEGHEKFVSHAYEDSLGYLTIGIGRLIDKRKGGGISRDEALYLLRNDLRKIEDGLDKEIPWWRGLSESRQRVLMNMAFNLGIAGLMKFKNTLAYVRNEEYDKAADAMLNSEWAKQVGYRAKELSDMMRAG